MKKTIFLFFILLAISVFCQFVPTAEPVYGGRIEHIRSMPLSSTETRVFITTNSANSAFYADFSNITTTPAYSAFSVVPDLDDTAGFGWLRGLEADEFSQFIYVIEGPGALLGTDINSGSLITIETNEVIAIQAHAGWLFYIIMDGNDMWLYWGQIYDLASPFCGQLYNQGSALVTSAGYNGQFAPDIIVNHDNGRVYIFEDGNPPIFYKSSDIYNTLTTFTAFSTLTVNDLTAVGMQFNAAGIAPDGRIFAGGYTGDSSAYDAYIAYSDSDGDPWINSTISQDTGRGEIFVTQTDPLNYNVIFSRVISTDNGFTWDSHGGADGSVFFESNNDDLAYVRTDWALGACEISSPCVVTEINEGIQAVRVFDFAMDETKDIAWVASKSGIWYVYDYITSSPAWTSSPLWPDGDSTPYITVKTTATGDSVYVGNTSGNAFKYESSYGTLTGSNFDRIFEAHVEDATWTYGTKVTAIALDPLSSSERTFIGTSDDEDFDETTATQGGIFVGDYSSGWSWTQIIGTPLPCDGVEVNDIVVLDEGGVTVVYVAVEYVFSTGCGTGTSIYRIEDDGIGGWIISQDLYDISGNLIAVSVFDMWLDSSQNIYACGIDAGGTTVVSYYKAFGNTYWDILPTGGLPTTTEGKSITVDEATGDVYMAIENDIWFLMSGAVVWTNILSNPEGNDIEFVYFDDLLFGSGTGLYSLEMLEYPLSAPQNVVLSGDETNIYLDWDPVFGATSYSVYSDTDPYGSFSNLVASGILTNNWSGPAPTEEKKFYIVIAEN